MNIEIAQRQHPFSHALGIQCLIPLSWWQVKIFPTRLCFTSLVDSSQQWVITLGVLGPMEGFTAEMDLEKGGVRVFGMTQKGYVRYHIRSQEKGICLEFDKVPEGGIEYFCHQTQQKELILDKHAVLLNVGNNAEQRPVTKERLSLGIHKAQDWELMCRRCDLKEIFPIWLRAGQLTPPFLQAPIATGTLRLLMQCEQAIAQADSAAVLPLFLSLFRTAFSGMMTPRLQDEAFQGILPQETIALDLFAVPILCMGAELIRSFFFKEESPQNWTFLPCLPSAFASGRFVGISTAFGETIALEWAKHRLRKVVIHTASARSVQLQFPRSISSVRLRTSRASQGKTLPLKEGMLLLELKAQQVLLLDRFER